MDQLRIAFFAAVPGDQAKLRVETEYKSIQGELEKSRFSERFDPRFEPATGRRDLLSRLLKVKPQIVHFSGHGTEREELIFETEDGYSEPVGPAELELLFSAIPVAERPRIVVLSACYSEAQAAALTNVLDCVIGMSSDVLDRDALNFAVGFYAALGEGLPVDGAVDLGRFAMSQDSRELPQLHIKDGTTLSDLTLVGQGPVSSFPNELHLDRDEQIDCFTEMLSSGQPKVLLVRADGNMGKSQLMKRMAKDAGDTAAGLGYADLTHGAPSPVEIVNLLALGLGTTPSTEAALFDKTSASVNTARPDLQAARRANLVEITREVLQHAEQLAADSGRRVALLLDGYDDTNGDVAVFVERILLPQVVRTANVVCVLAGRAKPAMLAGIGDYQEHELANFAEGHVREAMQILRLNASADVVRTLWLHSESGHPYATMQALRRQWADAVGRAG